MFPKSVDVTRPCIFPLWSLYDIRDSHIFVVQNLILVRIHPKYECGFLVWSEIFQTTRVCIVFKSSTGSPFADSPVTIVIYEPRTVDAVKRTSDHFSSLSIA